MQQKSRRVPQKGIQKSLMIIMTLTLAFVCLGVLEALSAYHFVSGFLSELASLAIVILAVVITIWQSIHTSSSRVPSPVPSDPADATPTTLLPAIASFSQVPAIDATPTTLLPAIPPPSQVPTIDVAPTIAISTIPTASPPLPIEATPTIAVPSIPPATPQLPIEATPTITLRLPNKAHVSGIAARKQVLAPIFHFNEPHLPTQDELYGRKRESITLLDRARKGLCTSIEGPRGIGKTWLLDYLNLELCQDKKILLGSINGTASQCHTVAKFCACALEAFGLTSMQENANLDILSTFVREQKSRGITSILCIDQFEGLLNEHLAYPFFTSLCYIAQHEGLALVMVSKKPLIELVSEHCKSSSLETSPFFNIVQPIKLGPFNLGQAEEFTEEKSAAAGWNDEEYAALLKYAQTKKGWLPLLLQLVGQLLQMDKHLATTGDPTSYRPTDPTYWSDFQRRVREQYRQVVPK